MVSPCAPQNPPLGPTCSLLCEFQSCDLSRRLVMGRAGRVRAGRNTTTEVVGKLYGRGLTISRDRLYTMTELIFGNTEVQPRHGLRRHYTDEQIDQLAAAFWLKEAGRDDEEIAALFRSPETAAEVQRLVAKHIRWLDSLEELAARATTTA